MMTNSQERKKNIFFALLIIASIIVLYGILAFINIRTPMISCADAKAGIENVQPQMSLLAGEWLCYTGAPDIDALSDLSGNLADVMHIGIMEGRTYRMQLQGETLDDLCFMLPRSRGSKMWIDGSEVLPQNGPITSRDVFAFADYLNQETNTHDVVLRIPVSGYFYSGYQGIVIGLRERLEAIDQTRYFIEVLCLGL